MPSAMASGRYFSQASFDIVPVADGGEGTAGIFLGALGGEWVEAATHDALGRPITASYAWMGDQKLAVIEMSAASGLWRIKSNQRDPLRAHTLGTGELIADAIARGAEQLLVGLGGSATNDAGVGMASALGWKFLDAANNTLAPSPAEFCKISKIVPPGTPLSCRVTGLCDVNNPLLGAAGATRTFGPQKGASPEMLATLEESLAHVALLCSEQFGKDLSLVPGAGAAGGLGFGLLTFLQATLESGFNAISRLDGFGEPSVGGRPCYHRRRTAGRPVAPRQGPIRNLPTGAAAWQAGYRVRRHHRRGATWL